MLAIRIEKHYVRKPSRERAMDTRLERLLVAEVDRVGYVGKPRLTKNAFRIVGGSVVDEEDTVGGNVRAQFPDDVTEVLLLVVDRDRDQAPCLFEYLCTFHGGEQYRLGFGDVTPFPRQRCHRPSSCRAYSPRCRMPST